MAREAKMMRVWLWLWLWQLGFGFALAQEVPDGELKRMKSDPGADLELAADLIHGFGAAQGIDRAGIARFVALERAALRAGGWVDLAEVKAAVLALGI
jgi:hypothetical protein